MKIKDVVLKLYEELPKHTDKFTVSLGIQSISKSLNFAVVTTVVDHNLTTNDVVTIGGVKSPINIISMTRNGIFVEAEAEFDHDLTEGYQDTVIVDGAIEPEFNGEFKLIKVKNRKSFTFQKEDSGPIVATGTMRLLNGTGLGYNGIHQVEVLSNDQFRYELKNQVSSNGIVEDSTLTVGYRITGAVDIGRALEIYTKNESSSLWAFVVLGNVVASKDRETKSDAVYIYSGAGTQYRQTLIQPLSIYVVAPAATSVSGSPQRDEMEDLFPALTKSILGASFDSKLAQKAYYRVVFDQHGYRSYDTALYVHEFRFQSVCDLTFADTVGESYNVAFRDISLEMTTNLMNENTQKINVDINLDDKPIQD
jgi:hypothetical protein